MNDHRERFETIIKKLKENGNRLTPQRLAVAKVLALSEGHPSAENIYEQLQDDFPSMSLATVYRNVMLIKSLGEVLELGFPDGSNRYDGNMPWPHPHVVCLKCKQIINPKLTSLKDMTRKIAAETGFEILTHRLDFFGICRECRNNT